MKSVLWEQTGLFKGRVFSALTRILHKHIVFAVSNLEFDQHL